MAGTIVYWAARAPLSAALLLWVGLVSGCASAIEENPPGGVSQQVSPQSQTPEPIISPDSVDADQARLSRAQELVAAMSLAQVAAQTIMVYLPGSDPASMGRMLGNSGAGGIILMSENIPPAPEDLMALTGAVQSATNPPPLIAIDQEGGDVSRLPWDSFLGADELRFAPPEDTAQAFADRAQLLNQMGISVNFGIVADIDSNPDNFIYWRSFGDDAEQVSVRVAAAVAGENGLVASTLKHFPGHGAVLGDTHAGALTSSMSYADWRGSHAVPFEAGIAAGAQLVMFGHLIFPEIDSSPASLSTRWYQILREDLAFSAVTITDDLGMLTQSAGAGSPSLAQFAVQAVAAGADIALAVAGTTPESAQEITAAIVDAVSSGVIAENQLRESAVRVVHLRLLAIEMAGG